MRRKQSPDQQTTKPRKPTPTFLLEVPLHVTASQAKRLRAHLEAARQLYNAILSEGQRRLRRGCICEDYAERGGDESRCNHDVS